MSSETMVLPAIPEFIVDLNISYEDSSWILAAFLVTGAVITPIAGKLSDISCLVHEFNRSFSKDM